MEMSIQRKASQEAAAAIYGNDSSVATTSNRYVTFEQEAAMKKGKSAGGGSPSNDANRRATRISLDSLLSQVKGDHDKLSEKEKRLDALPLVLGLVLRSIRSLSMTVYY